MNRLEELEKKWNELIIRPTTHEELFKIGKEVEQERIKEYSGMIEELSEIGIHISSVWDLVNTKEKYPTAIPILLKYLVLVKNSKNKQGIIRALIVVEARNQSIPILLEEYHNASDDVFVRDVISQAINIASTKNDIELLLPFVLEYIEDDLIMMIIRALPKLKTEKVKETLLQLTNSKNIIVKEEALKALKKFK